MVPNRYWICMKVLGTTLQQSKPKFANEYTPNVMSTMNEFLKIQ
jgi:hypothetical protein